MSERVLERRILLQPRNFLLTLLLTFISAIFLFCNSTPARADLYNSSEANLPLDGLYIHFDQSSSGTVIATADGCQSCAYYRQNGYAYISTDGGNTFTAKTTLGSQPWRAVSVSTDGKKIALFTEKNIYYSPNSGSDFINIYSVPISDVTSRKLILSGVMAGDGRNIFISNDPGNIIRLTYNSSTRRWDKTLSVNIPNYEYSLSLDTTSDGSKTFIASQQGFIYKLEGNTLSAISDTHLFADNSPITWLGIQVSNSGNEIVALPFNSGPNGIFYKSTNGGSSFSAVTSINGVTLDEVHSVSISGDGKSTFLGTINSNVATLYSQHGSTATWYPRESISYYWDYEEISSNNDGTKILHRRYGYPIRILKATPETPSISYINYASANSLNVSWSYSVPQVLDTFQSINDVQIQFATSDSGPWTNFSDQVIGGSSGTSEITGLTSLTTYYFRVRAQNYFGYSPWSNTTSAFVYTPPSTPAAPTQLVSTDKSFLFLSFASPSSLGGASRIYDHEWQYSVDSGANWLNGNSSNLSFGYSYSNPSYTSLKTGLGIRNLPAGEPFMVRTRSFNNVAWSAWSLPGTFYVYKQPSAVTNLQVSNVYTTATLSWGLPADMGGGTLSSYQYAYKRSQDSSWTGYWHSETSTTITGLIGGTSYDFYVLAVTSQGLRSLTAYYYNGQAINPPVKLGVTRPSSGARSGEAFTTQPRISLLDNGNSVVTSESKALVIAEVNGDGILIGAESVTATSGVANFSGLGLRGKSGTTYTITYKSSNLIVATETITLQPGPIASIKFETSTVGGASNVIFPTQPSLSVVDADGNRVTSDETTTVTLSTNQGFLWNGSQSSPTARANQGLITFSDVRITGESGSSALLSYTTNGLNTLTETVTITTGPASTFTRTQRAADAYVGGSFGTQPIYQVTDSAGNVVTSGEYYISISPSQGTLSGKTTIRTINGIGTYTDLALSGVNASQLVILTVTSPGFTPYTGDSIVTRMGSPILSWSDFYIPAGTSPFTIPAPESSTAGTFSYSSSDSSVISISGSTVTVGNAGTATITATFTPTNTTNYQTGETVTAVFTVNPGAGTLIVSAAGGALQKGIRNNITATASDAGAVTFYANGKKIAGCIQLKTVNSVATCAWKPSIQGSVALTAMLVPNNEALSVVRATSVNYAVVRRTGRR